MQKPYRGDYKPDYEKWKKIGKKKSVGFFYYTYNNGFYSRYWYDDWFICF